MTKMNAMKNPILANKNGTQWDNPSGNVLEEIKEQDMSLMVGGAMAYTTGILYPIVSKYLGNKGYVCTLTKECQVMCQ